MTISGMNVLNIRTNASPKWDRTRCSEEETPIRDLNHLYHGLSQLSSLFSTLSNDFMSQFFILKYILSLDMLEHHCDSFILKIMQMLVRIGSGSSRVVHKHFNSVAKREISQMQIRLQGTQILVR